MNSNKFWAISGLYYENFEGYAYISPYYRYWNDQLNKFGVEIIEKKINDISDFEKVSKTLIPTKTKSILTVVDLYYLPYCSLYKKEHAKHLFEISKIDAQKGYYIYDHFFAFHGWVKKEIIEKSIESLNTTFHEEPIISYFYQINTLEPSFFNIVLDNYKGMNNLYIYPETSGDGLYGLDALPHIKKFILYIMSLDVNNDDNLDEITNTYYQIKEISNSRYHMFTFFEKYSYKKLSLYYESSHQNWLAISNMLLRFIVTKNKRNYLANVDERINNIQNYEEKIQETLESTFFKY
ncbi:hypothetical protein GLV96_02610 [Staphylococcus agnetis]|uniref:hypothetical protein n=1 Tax=Staphylococcus agnetis TaxID=985762 RepID=UPI0014300AF8|nr:hypothetical protein [Staphylococcus agnetis]NJH85449.1 hypothetical protein [Staphylococcus agnetis]NJI15980.1 hypothetical protein [Staphylococcus agnetis]